MSSIKQWSFSRLSVFEQCKYRAKLQYVDKIPEPERPLPPGKTEHANERGNRVHDAAEMFVKADITLIDELQHFATEMRALKALYAEGKVSLEGEWAHNKNWEPVAWASSDAWLRLKLDAFIHESPTHGIVVDYKTGRKHGNEVKHSEQGQLYMVSCFLRNPALELVTVEFWYLDQDDLTQVVYTRAQMEHFLRKFTVSGDKLTSCTDFPPNPNMFSCKWCPYGPKGTGHCTVGV